MVLPKHVLMLVCVFFGNVDKFEYVTCQSKQQISLWGDVMWGINRVLTCHFWGIAKLVRSCPLRQDYEVFPKKVLGEGCSGLVVMAKGRTDGRSLGGKVVQPGHSEAFEAVVSYYPYQGTFEDEFPFPQVRFVSSRMVYEHMHRYNACFFDHYPTR